MDQDQGDIAHEEVVAQCKLSVANRANARSSVIARRSPASDILSVTVDGLEFGALLIGADPQMK